MTEPVSARNEQARFARLAPGFSDPVTDAQACFRVVLEAMAHPGRVLDLPIDLGAPMPLGEAAAAIGLTLCDLETPIWLDRLLEPITQYLCFHCGAEVVASPEQSRFAFVGDAAELPTLDQFALGSDEYPDRST